MELDKIYQEYIDRIHFDTYPLIRKVGLLISDYHDRFIFTRDSSESMGDKYNMSVEFELDGFETCQAHFHVPKNIKFDEKLRMTERNGKHKVITECVILEPGKISREALYGLTATSQDGTQLKLLKNDKSYSVNVIMPDRALRDNETLMKIFKRGKGLEVTAICNKAIRAIDNALIKYRNIAENNSQHEPRNSLRDTLNSH